MRWECRYCGYFNCDFEAIRDNDTFVDENLPCKRCKRRKNENVCC